MTPDPAKARPNLIDGWAFLQTHEGQVPALWGEGDQVLWAEGEPLMIAAGTGVGKTTIAETILLAQLGIGPSHVFGFPVAPVNKPILYIAADRPRQAARSLGRMVGEVDADRLREGLTVWRGPLPFDIGVKPDAFPELVGDTGAGTVWVDSLGNIATGLSKDEVGSNVNRAFGLTVAAGIDVGLLHHHRKPSTESTKRPTTPSEIYGSQWITAGCGSIFFLEGEAADPLISLLHLKSPAEQLPPIDLIIDHGAGMVRVDKERDPFTLLAAAGYDGLTSTQLSDMLYPKASKRQLNSNRERARRILERLVRERVAKRFTTPSGVLYRVAGALL